MAKKKVLPEQNKRVHLWTVNLQDEWQSLEGFASNVLPPNLYELVVVPPSSRSMGKVALKPMQVETDNILRLPGSQTEYVSELVEKFWAKKEHYKRMGFVHKRGVMLEGEPGTGKTGICISVGRDVAAKGGIAIFVPASSFIGPLPELLKTIRMHQPDVPVLNIMEDINEHRDEMGILLSMLDGETQIETIFHLATTNFINKMDNRIVNRPSRFDEVIKVKSPNEVTRRAYFAHTTPGITDDVLDKLVAASDGMNFAHMKDLAICTAIYERDPQETAQRLRDLAKNNEKGAGFKCDDPDDRKQSLPGPGGFYVIHRGEA